MDFKKLIIALLVAVSVQLTSQNYTQYIRPMIGTGGHGHTFPGPTYPFGMVQLSPDTRIDGSWDGCSGYHYDDSIIYGFSHTHLSGTGCSDYGDFAFMPYFSEQDDLQDYKRLYDNGVRFSHKNEEAKAGYYAVVLNNGVKVELTATERVGITQYTAPKDGFLLVLLQLKHRDQLLEGKINQVDAINFNGKRVSKAWAARQELYFHSRFSKLPMSSEIIRDSNDDYMLAVKFEVRKGEVFNLHTGISAVNEVGALKNLAKEAPKFDFLAYQTNANAIWNSQMERIEVFGSNEDDKVKFYTALYHCFIHPSVANDVDKQYRGRDNKIHDNGKNGEYYSVFSLWDTYRSLHPLFNIIQPQFNLDFLETFATQYRQGARLPVWELSGNETNCMIGYHAVSVIWDAYHKGLMMVPLSDLYPAMKAIANENSPALNSYRKYGYVRAEDDAESVSKTLEYAYDDWCIAQMALTVGDIPAYDSFGKRSKNWMNVYDPQTGWMRPRKNSTQMTPFSPYMVDNHFTEANSFQYSFYVPHDMEDYIEMIGGKDSMDRKLDQLFTASSITEGREQADITGLIGQYAHGNEPSHHIPFLYNDRAKRNKIVDQIREKFYTTEPDGLIGNEDCGAMSAWYVWAAMGMYPVCPGSKEIATCRGIFDSVKIHSEIWILRRKKDDTSAFYVYPKSYKQNQYIINTNKQPYILPCKQIFEGKQTIKLAGLPIMYYKLNDGYFKRYSDSIVLDTNCTLTFYGTDTSKHASSQQVAKFYKLPNDRKVILKSIYNPQYHADGPMGLVDGIYGDTLWRKGNWQGYQNQDFEATIAFQKIRNLKSIKIRFLQDKGSWIFLPASFQIEVSDDNVHFKTIHSHKVNQLDKDEPMKVEEFKIPMALRNKYVRVKAQKYGKLPKWHAGAGGDAFIFIDEIEVD
jgi:predicted alpha-1,2-mannosidase